MSDKSPREIQTRRHMEEMQKAAELIRRGLRPSNFKEFVHDDIVNPKELGRLWYQYHDENAPAGRPRTSAANAISTIVEAAIASAMLVEYLRIAKEPDTKVDAYDLCAAWDQFIERVGWAGRPQVEGFATFTTMWLLARDYRAKIVRLRECDVCHASHVRFDQWCMPKLLECPHCRLLARKN